VFWAYLVLPLIPEIIPRTISSILCLIGRFDTNLWALIRDEYIKFDILGQVNLMLLCFIVGNTTQQRVNRVTFDLCTTPKVKSTPNSITYSRIIIGYTILLFAFERSGLIWNSMYYATFDMGISPQVKCQSFANRCSIVQIAWGIWRHQFFYQRTLTGNLPYNWPLTSLF